MTQTAKGPRGTRMAPHRVRGEFLTNGHVGAASELRACAELMQLGYHVYRCESPNAPFDLAAYKDGKCVRVEVKTMTEPAGTYAPSFSYPKNDEWDLLMVVAHKRIFIFEAGTTAKQARDQIRAAYGFVSTREPVDLRPCGTPAAYHRHRLRKEPICDSCRTAMADYGRKRREAIRGA